ncbi:MAG: NAD-dependent epimerase/dehydratase family protein [Candidatus Omnitrophota bacterium]|jgi:NAD dependent epimerase/dehydratase|nr:MAG: NAD-dependent epimerase/dehydratase family protein [Candidatus Omnitrophota bacterium]
MKTLQDQHVLVTGAGGFIGSHLAEMLAPRCRKVTALIHYDARSDWSNLEHLPRQVLHEVEVIAGDITDAQFVRQCIKGKDIVFHLAALIAIPYSYLAPEIFFRTNVQGTLFVLEACLREEVKRVITASTSECYGSALYTPMNEEHPLQAQSPYSASKIGADKAVESYCCSFNLPTVVVRPFNTYGPRQSARAVIPTIITQALSPQPDIRLGALSPIRDFTYVTDTAAGFISAATVEGIEGKTINLGVGKGISIGDLAKRICDLCGVEKSIACDEERIRPEKSEVSKLISDNANARRWLDWQPRIELEEGLRQTIAFMQAHPGLYKPEMYQR